MIFTALVIGSLSKTLKKESSRLQSTLGEMTNVVDETLDGSRLLRVFRVQDKWKSKFLRLINSYKTDFDKVHRRQELSSPLPEFLGVSLSLIHI